MLTCKKSNGYKTCLAGGLTLESSLHASSQPDVDAFVVDCEEAKKYCILAKAQASEASSKAKVQASGSKDKVQTFGSKAKVQTFGSKAKVQASGSKAKTQASGTDKDITNKDSTDEDTLHESYSPMSKVCDVIGVFGVLQLAIEAYIYKQAFAGCKQAFASCKQAFAACNCNLQLYLAIASKHLQVASKHFQLVIATCNCSLQVQLAFTSKHLQLEVTACICSLYQFASKQVFTDCICKHFASCKQAFTACNCSLQLQASICSLQLQLEFVACTSLQASKQAFAACNCSLHLQASICRLLTRLLALATTKLNYLLALAATNQLLPIMADKYEYEKRKKEKLEEVKARLDFGDNRKKSTRAQESAYSESRTISPRRQRRSRSPHHNPSVFTRLRRERSRSPRHEYKSKERRESTVFKRLRGRGRSASTHSDSRQESSRYTENYSESEDSEGGHWKSKSQRKKFNVEDDDLSQPWGQEAASNQERKKIPLAWRHPEGNHRQNFKKGGGFRSQHKAEKRPDRFALLTKTPKEILALEKGKFKTPPPMTTPVEKRNVNKFCEFHREVGHNTDECNHLRKQIKDMLKVGKLSHIIRELKQNSGKEQPKKKGETSGKEKPQAILMIQSRQNAVRQKITQSFSPDLEISFPPMGNDRGEEGHTNNKNRRLEGTKCIRMCIAVRVIFRDTHCEALISAVNNISGIRQITLLVKVGDEDNQRQAWMVYGTRCNFPKASGTKTFHGQIVKTQEDMRKSLSTWHVQRKAVSAVLMSERGGGRHNAILLCIRRAEGARKINVTPMEKLVLTLHICKQKAKRYSKLSLSLLITDKQHQSVLSYPGQCWSDAKGKGGRTGRRQQEKRAAPSTDGTVHAMGHLGDGCGEVSVTHESGRSRVSRLRIAEKMGVKNLEVNVDSKLVANQVNGTYIAKEIDMVKYLEKLGLSRNGPSKLNFSSGYDLLYQRIEAKPVAKLSRKAMVKKFVWENLVCPGLVHSGEITSDNGKQYRDKPLQGLV
ncbi:hypothetical protein Tco_1080863 [Tanacetum coccineum]|uniref:Reverse transcriptase domain-containing protein n=1 Tax=Tanacetum coccineum TaxID=301880 RepID=A0ABQ5HXU9_9ASTR